MTKLITIALLIGGFFNPSVASWAFIGFFVLLELYIVATQYSGKGLSSDKLNERENELLQKYNVSVRYPIVSKNLSAALSAVQLSTFIWVPLLTWKKEYPQAVIIVLNYLPAGLLSQKLNPRFFLDQVAKKGKGIESVTAAIERDEITALMEKVYSKPTLK